MNNILSVIVPCFLMVAGWPYTRNDIFKVSEAVAFDTIATWEEFRRGVDNEGNFYWLSCDLRDDGEWGIYKYDQQRNEVMYFADYEGFNYPGHFCFDNYNNFCYLMADQHEQTYTLRRITPDGMFVSDQEVGLPYIPDLPEFGNAHNIYGLCSDARGNIFILAQDYYRNISYYRLTPGGELTEPDIDLSTIPIDENGIVDTRLYITNDGTQFVVAYQDEGMGYWQTNPATGEVKKMDSRVHFYDATFAAGSHEDNPYVLDGYRIIMLRPYDDTDLIVGTIPNHYKDANGNFKDIEQPEELYMNADGTVFYVIEGNEAFKLTH